MVDRILKFWSEGDPARFEPLFRGSPLLIHSIDTEGRILQASDYWLKFFGYAEEDVIGRKSSDFLTPASRTKAIDKVLPKFFESGVCNDVEYEFVKNDGSVVDISLSAVAERDAEGKVFRSFAILFDITSRKQAERKSEQARQEAERASLAKSRFLSALSHEFRTPLNAIVGFSALVEMNGLTDKQHEYLEHIADSARQLSQLTDDLLDLARIEEGHASVQIDTIDPEVLLQEIAGKWRQQFLSKRLSFDLELPADPIPLFDGDRLKISQIIGNFLSNAYKFTKTGGVRLHASVDENNLQVMVIDTGEGLRAEDRERVFERFEQGQGHHVDPSLGWGLGLAISRNLASVLGGVVGVESEYGQGASFWVRVPMSSNISRQESLAEVQS